MASTHAKLPKLPPNSKLQKRPLLRPPLPPAHASSARPKTVYVSAATPFMSAVSRTRTLLLRSQQRRAQSLRARTGGQGAKRRHVLRGETVGEGGERGAEEGWGEVVWIKGTGRAVEKVLGLGEWFRRAEGGKYGVVLRTGSVWAVDDVVREEEEEEETRVRRTSCLEVGVSLR